MGSTSKLCEIADAGPLVHTMSWEEIGKACGDASLRIAELEAVLRFVAAELDAPLEPVTRVQLRAHVLGALSRKGPA